MRSQGPVVALVVAVMAVAVLIGLFPPERVVTTDGEGFHLRTASLTTGDPADSAELARDVFDRANAERVHRGLHALTWDDELAERAAAWSVRMPREGYEHSDGAFRSTDRYRATGENIAAGQLDTRELHVGWMESDGHRANLLAADAVALGVGIVCRGNGTMWSTQIFGFASSAHPAPPPPPGWPVEPSAEPIIAVRDGHTCPSDAWG